MSALTPHKRSMMTIYSKANDIYSHRVRLVLAEKGIPAEVVDVDKVPKAYEELSELNPYGTTPALLDRDLVLYTSEIIMEYLDERFPHPPLMPVYPVARGRTRLMIYRLNRDWYSSMQSILNKSLPKSDIEQAQKRLTESITSVTPVFSEMPYFLSEEFSLLDCCIVPLLWRLPMLGIELPPQAKSVITYAERMFERESFLASLTDAEKAMRN